MNASFLPSSFATPALPRLWRRVRHWPLAWAMLLSVSLHLVLLSLEFMPPEPSASAKRDEGLEIVLVNARNRETPTDAKVLGQSSLIGGGNERNAPTPTTTEKPRERERSTESPVETRARHNEKPSPAKPTLSRRNGETAASDSPQTRPGTPAPSGLDLLDQTASIARLHAALDEKNQPLNGPRRRFFGANVKEYRFARYIEDWRLKVERIGTLNYPEEARGKLYGSLLMSVAIGADGELLEARIERSSGHPVLDQAALRIVRLGAPYAPFPPEIRADTDVIVIKRTWTFTRESRLQGN